MQNNRSWTLEYLDSGIRLARDKQERKISPLLRTVAMLAIAAVACTIFTLIRGDRAAGLIYLFVGACAISGICAALFYGRDL